jgi:ribosomal protein S18 acetylase RimI-like enzyme
VAAAGTVDPTPRSLVWATDIDVLPLSRQVERRDGFLVVRSPSNPTHYWGNLLLFDRPPARGDRIRCEQQFQAEFAGQPQSTHRTFGWDQTDEPVSSVRDEFVAHGYMLERNVGLIASAERIHPHPRASREVTTRPLDPSADPELWDQVVELQVAGRDRERFTETAHRTFCRRRQVDLRALFAAGRGAWYVALSGGEVVGSCGIVVTDGRGRYQAVETAPAHRRRGICSRLVLDAAHDAARRYGARRLVIVADPEYHALGLYESLGFEPVERVCGVCLADEGPDL